MRTRTSEAIWIEEQQRWQIRVQVDGQRKAFYSSTPGKKGKAEAEHKADEWLSNACPSSDVRFADLTERYLSHLRTGNGTAHKNRQEATIRLYLSQWNRRKVSSLTIVDYQEAIDACVEGREHPLSKRTCSHVRSTISALWKFAARAKIQMEQPIGLTIPTAATKGKRHILQHEDVRKLFSPELDKYYNVPLFRFIVLTGLRPGEVCGLRMEDLNGDTLTINRAINVNGETTTGKNENARRTIVLPPLAVDAIKMHHQQRKEKAVISPWLFCNTQGKNCNEKTLYHAWMRLRQHGITATSLYELRHTMISLLKDDLPLPMLKQVVGHSASMDTLGQYGHEVNGEKKASAEKIAGVYDQILNGIKSGI